MSEVRLLLGDCLDKLKEMDDNSVDSIVTDPPYGLAAAPNSGKTSKGGFMGKQWDYDVPSIEIWKECLRVLKPGGHILAFGATRTYHRMTVAIEDAGFEIRDCLFWCYGSGFPKSHNIGKEIQKKSGNVKVLGKKKGAGSTGKTYISAQEFDADLDKGVFKKEYDEIEITNDYKGWGTSLKPAVEPVVMARKPFKGSVAENVLEWGTGGLNIDECRIGNEGGTKKSDIEKVGDVATNFTIGKQNIKNKVESLNEGRWPANLILDEEAGAMLDKQSGIKKGEIHNKPASGIFGNNSNGGSRTNSVKDIGGASRFFYCPKVSKGERNEGLEGFEEKQTTVHTPVRGKIERNVISKNDHPTVKPQSLMAYLIKLVTPKGGTVLDPFMGSGSTGKAAVKEGYSFIGIEKEEEYFQIAEARINHSYNPNKILKEFFE